jgi:molybdopterin synthase catalytic subunit
MKTHIEFTHSPIVPPPMRISANEIGAQVEFLGIVRELEGGQAIEGLHYEAHEPMARSTIEKIFSELAALYPCEEVWLIHRLDFVPVGETALFLRIHSRHRQSAFGLAEAVIDRIKTDAPIWKRS